MSFLSKLFGKSEQKPAEPVMYEGYEITPQPIKEGHVYRLSAIIEKDGQSHHLIRADTLPSVEAAHEAAIEKAKQVIDQQGARLF